MALQAKVVAESNDGSGHFYEIEVESGGQSWKVERKHREFIELDANLAEAAPFIHRGPLPTPGIMGMKDSFMSKVTDFFRKPSKELSAMSALFDFNGQRRQALDTYLQTLVQQVTTLEDHLALRLPQDVPLLKRFLTPYGVSGWSYVDKQQQTFVKKIPTKSPEKAGYKMVSLLGKGNQGSVYRATDWRGNAWALKVCPKNTVVEDKVMAMAEEVELMRKVDSRYVAKVQEVFQDEASFYVVSEIYSGGDLRDLCPRAEKAGVTMTEEWWRDLFRQCYVGLYHLHNNALVHCDIKEGNIMLKKAYFSKPEVVIVDFGLAQMNVGSSATLAGTPGYIPPETWQTGKWFPEGDVFSMGVVMVQMLADSVPITPSYGEVRFGVFTAGVHSNEEIRKATETRDLSSISEILPTEYVHLKQLIPRVTEKDLGARLRVLQVLDMPWFSLPVLNGPEYNPQQAKMQRLGQSAPQEAPAPLQQQPASGTATSSWQAVGGTAPSSWQQVPQQSLQQPQQQQYSNASSYQLPAQQQQQQYSNAGNYQLPQQCAGSYQLSPQQCAGSYQQPQPSTTTTSQQPQPYIARSSSSSVQQQQPYIAATQQGATNAAQQAEAQPAQAQSGQYYYSMPAQPSAGWSSASSSSPVPIGTLTASSGPSSQISSQAATQGAPTAGGTVYSTNQSAVPMGSIGGVQQVYSSVAGQPWGSQTAGVPLGSQSQMSQPAAGPYPSNLSTAQSFQQQQQYSQPTGTVQYVSAAPAAGGQWQQQASAAPPTASISCR